MDQTTKKCQEDKPDLEAGKRDEKSERKMK
jgi:hypothetical protein